MKTWLIRTAHGLVFLLSILAIIVSILVPKSIQGMNIILIILIQLSWALITGCFAIGYLKANKYSNFAAYTEIVGGVFIILTIIISPFIFPSGEDGAGFIVPFSFLLGIFMLIYFGSLITGFGVAISEKFFQK